MSRRRNWIIDALAAVTIATLLVAGFALAHPAGDFYPAKWQRDKSVEWRFDDEFPGGDFRDSVEFGARQWNELGPNMHFDKQTPEYGGFPAAECPDRYQKDGIHWGAIDGQNDTLRRGA
jgi:hypothetical protein